MSEWKRVELQDCCLSISDGDHLPPPKTESGIPFVTIADIKNNQFDLSNTRFVPEEYFNRIDQKRRIQKGDVLFSVVGSYGIPVFAREDMRVAFQRHIAILRPGERVVPEFMYYSMLDRNFYLRVDAVAIGAAQKTITLSALRSLEIDLPPLATQCRIAAVLSDYDAVIANCRKQIALLEEAAMRLYREWFGDGKGENGRIGDFVKIKRGKVITKANAVVGSVPVIAAGTAPACFNDKANVFGPSVTISASGANAGHVWFHSEDIWASDCSYVSRSESPYVYFCYAMLLSKQQEISKQQKGSAQPHVHASDVEGLAFVIPEIDKVEKFERCVTPQFEMIGDLSLQIRSLTEARDRLLPKLMKGEIAV